MLANQAAHESTLRNAVLVESVQGLEDIKLMQAENRFLQQWNSYIRITGESGLRTRKLTQGHVGTKPGLRRHHYVRRADGH